MPLPPLTPEGRLPARGAGHFATMSDIEAVFVHQAPNAERRAVLFKALEAWLAQAALLFGPSRVWVDGGFVTHKLEEPGDVDLVLIPDDPDRANLALATADAAALLTQFDVITAFGFTSRWQPMGGLIDAFVADPRRADRLAYWHQQWSRVKNEEINSKGYVEVVI